jgi:hypothetical protein
VDEEGQLRSLPGKRWREVREAAIRRLAVAKKMFWSDYLRSSLVRVDSRPTRANLPFPHFRSIILGRSDTGNI